MEPMVCGAVVHNPYITAIEGAGAKGLREKIICFYFYNEMFFFKIQLPISIYSYELLVKEHNIIYFNTCSRSVFFVL